MHNLNFKAIDVTWLPIIHKALEQLDPSYLTSLQQHIDWLPGSQDIFNAFSLPLPEVNYILFGESPYPRPESANGYAFWDNNVANLWSENGLSKQVNRATSLRNFIKMLLVVEGYILPSELSQQAISQLPKIGLIQTAADLFNNMQRRGILLLNASLVLSPKPVKIDANAWRPFMASVLEQVYQTKPSIQLILLGNIAKIIPSLPKHSPFRVFSAEHPYNISFISNKEVQNFFKPFNLLTAEN